MKRNIFKPSLGFIAPFLFFVVTNTCFGQLSYYKTATKTKFNIKIYKDSEINQALFCKITDDEGITETFTPDEILGYGTKSGQVFDTFEITYNGKTQKYFLEKLSGEPLPIYYLRTRDRKQHYYLYNKDKNELEKLSLNSDSLKQLFIAHSDACPDIRSDIKHLQPDKYKIKRLANNLSDCNSSHLPRIRFGIKAGLHLTHVNIPKSNNLFSITEKASSWNTTIGLFMDIPIRSSNYSFAPEISYKKMGILYEFSYSNDNFDLLYNAHHLNFILPFKYTFLKGKINPFVITGPEISLVNETSGAVIRYTEDHNLINLSVPADQISESLLKGFTLGGGFIYNYGNKISWFCELRYDLYSNMTKSIDYFTFNQFTINTGILF